MPPDFGTQMGTVCLPACTCLTEPRYILGLKGLCLYKLSVYTMTSCTTVQHSARAASGNKACNTAVLITCQINTTMCK